VVNINQYKSISQLNIANNDVVKSFLVNEEEYNKIINENIKCIGNNKLHKLKLNDKQKRHVKHNLEKYVGNRFLEETLSDEKKKYNKNNINVYRNIAYSMYINRGFFKFIERLFIKQFDIDGTIKKVVNDVYSEACYFPVAVMESNKGSYPFGNTWMGARNYGGNRKHEGTDIMYTENKEDVVPIVSVSDGIVDKKGWLELGGYRVLIKTDRNVKFYYAHLSSYAKGIEEGVKVKAGQLLGYMGSTGYGKEGTKGKFDVHLHFGMYYKDSKSGKDVGLNPYFLLKLLNSNKLYYK
jgi:murein DD-endopeptidase MepM/ murein hydrolase activator NlpD